MICMLVIGLVGCSKPLDKEQAVKNLKTQAGEVGQAILKENHHKMADLTHPTLVEKLGGRTRFIQRLEAMAADMKKQGFRFKEITMSEPSELVERSREVYAIVSYKLVLLEPDETPVTQPSYLIGVSKDRGGTWNFIDGSGIAGSQEKLKQVLPNFPSTLSLPVNEPPTRNKR
jgi:hypothetical protein